MEKNNIDIKKEYEEIKKKYKLVEFQKLDEDFDIGRLMEKESFFLLREIRKAIVEKIIGYSHFFENLINPVSPPMFLFSIIKKLTKEEKEEIKDVYKTVSKLQIRALKIDTIYSEEKEADFIGESYKEWQKIKEKVQRISTDARIKDKLGEQVMLNERQMMIMEYLHRHNQMSNKDFRKIFPDFSDDTVLRELKFLRQKGLLKKTGGTKKAIYVLK